MSSYISFDSKLAKKYGVGEAIFIHHFQYMLNHHKNHNKNFHDGRYWNYNSMKYFTDHMYDFWSIDQIRTIIKSLINQKVILTGNYNKIKYDRTTWYAFVDESLFLNPGDVDSSQMVKTPNGSRENGALINSDTKSVTSIESTLPKNQSSAYRIPGQTVRNPNGSRENPEPIPSTITSLITLREALLKNPDISSDILPSASVGFCETSSLSKSLSSEKKKRGRRRSESTELPEGWVLPVEWMLWATNKGFPMDQIPATEIKFRNHWHTTSKDNTKRDWYKTWQIWILNECKFQRITLCLKKEEVPKEGTMESPKPLVIKQSTNIKIQQWNELQPVLRDRVGSPNYDSWLKNLELIQADSKSVLKAPSKFIADWVSLNYIGEVAAILTTIDPQLGIENNIEFVS